MTTPLRIVVEWDPNLLNPNRAIRLHWHEKSRRRNVAIDAARLAWKAAGRPQMPGKVRVSVTICRARSFDEDNAWGSLKAVKDALFCGKRFADDGGAITPDDSRQYVQLGEVRFDIGKQWKGREQVIFEVEPAEACLAGAPAEGKGG